MADMRWHDMREDIDKSRATLPFAKLLWSLLLLLLLGVLLTLMARLKARWRNIDLSAGMPVKKAARCCVINADVLTVLSRWDLDAVFVWLWSDDAITANSLAT